MNVKVVQISVIQHRNCVSMITAPTVVNVKQVTLECVTNVSRGKRQRNVNTKKN